MAGGQDSPAAPEAGSLIDPASRVDAPGPVRAADLVVGIPSYREADCIGHVVEQVGRGLREFYPELRSVIVNVDNASPDDTKLAFLRADSNGVRRVYLSTPPGLAGKGRNFHNLFSVVAAWEPKAVAVVDADLQSILPRWMKILFDPVMNGYDYVAPLYARHPYDGTITNHICYPLLRAIAGLELRQPIAGDFAFSPGLVPTWLAAPWRQSTCEYGIDVTMTVRAIFAGARLAQVPLGAKIHKPSAPKLGPMFLQVVDSLFGLLEQNRRQWSGDREPPVVDTVGPVDDQEPQDLVFDHEKMGAEAKSEYPKLRQQLLAVLQPATLKRVQHAFDADLSTFDADLWMRCVYDSLAAYFGGETSAAVPCLKPLYQARVVAFVMETQGSDHSVSEAAIVDQAIYFRDHLDYLMELLA